MGVRVPGRLSVKEVAEVAGVTPRTVRYYHSVGVLPEPPRDGSGYRRYGGKEVVDLVRAVRLRALGMPLTQVAERVGAAEPEDVSLADALGALADELDVEIERAVATRNRLRALAKSETFDQPVKTLTQALQDQGILGPADRLRTGERWAAAVLDAVHPDGMSGVLAEASSLFDDSGAMAALRPLRSRLRKLNAHTTDAEVASLAADVAAVLRPRDGEDGGGPVDIGLVDLVLTDRLNPTQQRFMRHLRSYLRGGR